MADSDDIRDDEQARDQEREDFARFAKENSEVSVRPLEQVFYAVHAQFGKTFFFGHELKKPHIEVNGRPHPHALAQFRPLTGHGADVGFVFDGRIALGTHPGVFHPWPAEGTANFLCDYVLKFATKQHVFENLGAAEDDSVYGGYGPRFAAEANRIADLIGPKNMLGHVIARRRGKDDAGKPLARNWPHCVRPEGYYGVFDLDVKLIDRAAGRAIRASGSSPAPSLGLVEMILLRLNAYKAEVAVEKAKDLIKGYLDWHQRIREGKFPRLQAVEKGEFDIDGKTPLGEVTVQTEWLQGSNAVACKLAEAAHESRDYALLPILADALEDAGCDDRRILDHLRKEMAHSPTCWVLKLLLSEQE